MAVTKVWVGLDCETPATVVGVASSAAGAKSLCEADAKRVLTWHERSDGRFTSAPIDYPEYQAIPFGVRD